MQTFSYKNENFQYVEYPVIKLTDNTYELSGKLLLFVNLKKFDHLVYIEPLEMFIDITLDKVWLKFDCRGNIVKVNKLHIDCYDDSLIISYSITLKKAVIYIGDENIILSNINKPKIFENCIEIDGFLILKLKNPNDTFISVPSLNLLFNLDKNQCVYGNEKGDILYSHIHYNYFDNKRFVFLKYRITKEKN